MAGKSNTVTLTFAGDSAALESTLAKVQKGVKATSDGIDKSGKQIEESLGTTTKGVRGAGDVIGGLTDSLGGLGVAIPGPIGGLLSMGESVTGLTGGAKELVPALTAAKAAIAGVGFASTGAVLAVGGIVAAAGVAGFWLGEKLATAAGLGQKALDDVDTTSARNQLDAATTAAHTLAQALGTIGQHGLDPLNTGVKQAIGADQIGDLLNGKVNLNGSPVKATHTAVGGGARKTSTVSDAIKAAQAAATAQLNKWQSVIDQAKSVSDGIMDALAPEFDASGDQKGNQNIYQKLLQQAKDTIRLNKELKQLSKEGLNASLLTSLAAGGLDSLPAVDALAAGSKADIKWVNNVASMTNKAAGSIADDQATRDFAKSQKDKAVTLKVDLGGGEDELKKMFRKWIRTDGAKSFNLKAA